MVLSDGDWTYLFSSGISVGLICRGLPGLHRPDVPAPHPAQAAAGQRLMVRVLIPSGALGLGYDAGRLERGIAAKPDLIAIDGGSTDFRAQPTSGAACRNTPAPRPSWNGPGLMDARAEAGVPLVIGTAGTCGSGAAVDWLVEITEEILKETGRTAKIAVLKIRPACEPGQGRAGQGAHRTAASRARNFRRADRRLHQYRGARRGRTDQRRARHRRRYRHRGPRPPTRRSSRPCRWRVAAIPARPGTAPRSANAARSAPPTRNRASS
jgi:hypothetical protein